MNPSTDPRAFGKDILLRLYGAGFDVLRTADADPNALYVHIPGRFVSLGYSGIFQEADNPDAPFDEELSLFFGKVMSSDAHITAQFTGPRAKVLRGFLPPSAIDTFARYAHEQTYPTRELVDTMVSYFIANEHP